jgi:hypothetical protein
LSLRQKEKMVNYYASLFKPMDQDLEKTLKHIFDSNRVRLNHKLGHEMMKELKPYKIDIAKLGKAYMFDDDDNDIEQKAEEYESDPRLQLFNDEKADKNCKPNSFPSYIMSVTNPISIAYEDDWKTDEKSQVEKFELEKTTDQHALKDFVIKPYANIYDCQFDPKSYNYPINYYDNDDGYWDDWIAHKNRGYNENDMIVGRKHLKH